MYKFKKNNRKADYFTTLISPIYNDLYHYIYSIAKDHYNAEDILQETLYRSYNKLEKLVHPGSFKSWIFTIAKHEAFLFLKKNKHEFSLDIDTMVAINADKLSYEQSEFEPIPEKIDDMIAAFNHLKPDYQDIILLVYRNQLTLKEVASVKRANYNTVKSKHLRAIKYIQNYLVKSRIM